MGALAEQFTHTYAQRAVLESLILAGIAGALGPWILMRGLGFFAHAIGSASFPGLIFADAAGLIPQAGAVIGAGVVASGAGILRPSDRNGTRTALWLSGALAAGALIASNWSNAGSGVDAALFGSLLTSDWLDVLTAAIALFVATVSSTLAGPRWLAQGLTARKPKHWDAVLLIAVSFAVIAQLPATGALLASTMLVLPAAAAQPWSPSIRGWQLRTLGCAAAVSLGGLCASIWFDTPPGATIAAGSGLMVTASVFAKQMANRSRAGRSALATAAFLVAVLCAGCGPRNKVDVVTGTPIIASVTEEVAGNELKVKSLVPAGADPHEWEPRPSDTAAIADARLLVLSGGGLDSWANRLRSRSGSDAATLDLYPTLPNQLNMPESDGPDPHWFHDPVNVGAAALTIAEELSKLDPSHAATFKANAAKLANQASRLDAQGKACVARLQPDERRLITDHDAFQYLAKRLGLIVEGTLLSSQSTAASPTPAALDELIRQIRAHKVKAVFPERSLDSRLAKSIAGESGVRADVQLDADTLGPNGSSDATWAGMWAGNINRLTSALSGGRVVCKVGGPS
jgi:ABC-type Zn uptake system ZnuABC Zn-binding protein ZnuA